MTPRTDGLRWRRILLLALLLSAVTVLAWPALKDRYDRYACWRIGANSIGGGICVFIDLVPDPARR